MSGNGQITRAREYQPVKAACQRCGAKGKANPRLPLKVRRLCADCRRREKR